MAVGGAIGACVRYWVFLATSKWQLGFPYATLGVNAIGCFLIGVIMSFVEHRHWTPEWRTFLVTGLLGSMTTFSTFGYETYVIWASGQRTMALAVVGTNLLLGLSAVALGWRAGAP